MQLAERIVRKTIWLRQWPNSGFRYRAYLRKQRDGNPITFRFPKRIVISLHPAGVVPERLYVGIENRSDLSLVISFLKPRMQVVDVGANVGLYSIIAEKLVRPGGRVWAFEPSTESYERLLCNLSLNNAISVIPVKMALADRDGEVITLRRESGFRDGDRYLSQANAHLSPRQIAGDLGDSEQVRVTTLDHHLAQCNGFGKVDFMKIDVEGGEYAVLRGAREVLLANHQIVLMFECQPHHTARMGHRQEDVYRYLGELGFQVYCWQYDRRTWDTTLRNLLTSLNVWACRDKRWLPRPGE